MEAIAALRNNALDIFKRSIRLSKIMETAGKFNIWEIKSDYSRCYIRAFPLSPASHSSTKD